jgi:nicotinamide mononucleotide (NMN) deamidase PncC
LGMVTSEQQAPGGVTVAQRWLARGAISAAVASVLVPLVAVGLRASLAVVVTGVVGLGLAAAGVWWALTHKGPARWLATAVAVGAPLVVVVLYMGRGLLWPG